MDKIVELGTPCYYPTEDEIMDTLEKAKSGDEEAKRTLYYWIKYCVVPKSEKEFYLADKLFDAISEIAL